MDSVDAVRRVLVWAAGGSDRPDVAAAPQADLVEALFWHRLESRLLHRARREGVALPAALEAQLVESHAEVLARVRRQITLFREVRDAVGPEPGGPGLVPVKGFSLYALTQDPAHAARSKDVDVLGPDPMVVAAAVESTGGGGYHFHGEEHPYVFAHMDGVEVHSRYLVTGIVPAPVPVVSDSAPLAGAVELTTPFSVAEITYDDLVEQLLPGVGDAAGVDVLRPELAVIIRCAHVYVGYAMLAQPYPWGTVRLEELAQIRDYLALPSFDVARFRALHERLDAGLVTDFMRALQLELCGDDPFATVGAVQTPVREQFPHNLWWDGIGAGFPVDLDWSPWDLVGCASTLGDLADRLGPTTVVLPRDGRATLSFLEDDAPDAADRYYFHRYSGGLDSVRLVLDDSPEHLGVTVLLPPVEDGRMAAIGLEAGAFRYEVFYRPADGTYDFSDYSSRPVAQPPRVLACTSGPSGVELRLEAPWPSLGVGDARPTSESFPLMFRSRVQDRPWGDVVGGVVAPLRVGA